MRHAGPFAKFFGQRMRPGKFFVTKLLTNSKSLRITTLRMGQLAQLVEHRLHTAGVTSSSLVLPTTPKTVITPACHAGGRGFESLPFRQYIEIKGLCSTLKVNKVLFFIQLAFMGVCSCSSLTTRLGSICEGECTGFAQSRSEYLNPTFTKKPIVNSYKNKILSSFTKKFPAFLVSPKQSTGLLLGLSEAPCVF